MPSNATPQIGNHAAYNGSACRNPARGVLDVVLTVRVDIPLPATVVGLKEHAGGLVSAGVTPQAKVTVPVNPFVGVMVTVDVAEAPAEMEAGDNAVAERVKSGVAVPVTVKVTVALCASAPEIPVTVNVYVLAGVLAVVETVNADGPAPATDVGLNEQVGPLVTAGLTLLQDSVTVPVNPDNAPMVTVEVAELPAATDAGANAVAATLKSGKPALGANLAMNASAMPPPNEV